MQLDRERGWLALLAPPPVRPPMAALFGLDAALGWIALRRKEPMAGLVRCQWWREALEAAAEAHPGTSPHVFLEPLAGRLRDGSLPREGLADLLAAYEAVIEARQLPEVDEIVRFADRTGARMNAYAMMLVGGDRLWVERARRAGRALVLLRLAGQLPLLKDAGLAPPRGVRPSEFARVLAAAAREELAAASNDRPPRRLLVPMLVLRLARRRLQRLERADFEPAQLARLPPSFALPSLLLARLTGRP